MHLQNCYIHKRTPELIEKVIELGYRYCNQYDNTCDALHTRIESTYSSAHFVDEHYSVMDSTSNFDGVNCGDNEDLFLAIAALRDDTDINQWFIFPDKIDGDPNNPDHYPLIIKPGWFLAKEDGFTASRNEAIYAGENPINLPRKATVQELIDHFKYKAY